MTKNINQFIIGAIVGAAAYEIVKKKNPQLVTEVKQNLKELGTSFEGIYKEVRDIVKKASKYKHSTAKASKRTTKRKGGNYAR